MSNQKPGVPKKENQLPMEQTEYDTYPSISNIASAGECTGLMYAPPQNQEEFESYQDLSDMELPKKKD